MRWHVAGVRTRRRAAPPGSGNHLALTVHGLPTPANPDGMWLVDVGLGDALYDATPLRSGPVVQGGFRYALSPSPVLAGGWRFRHDSEGSFGGFDLEPEPATPADFALAHADLSTSPTSGFVQRLTAQRRHATGCDKLINCTLRRTSVVGTVEQELTSSDQLRRVLSEEFGLPLDDYDPADWELVWRRARAGQDEYKAAQRGLLAVDGG